MQKSETKSEEGWWRFISHLSSLKKRGNVELFLDLFLTHEERHDLGLRYLIIEELIKKKKTQREIAKELDISIGKITRGSNALKSAPSNLRRILTK
ncbi:MAG: trp operon repressor [Chlamydiae bacterium]|nr:trp operon repressor [Chlamydiota bacterium]